MIIVDKNWYNVCRDMGLPYEYTAADLKATDEAICERRYEQQQTTNTDTNSK